MADEVLGEVADGVGVLTINRPQVRNAINLQMQQELRDVWTGFRYDDDGSDHSRESRDDRDNFFIVRRWTRAAAGGGELGGRGRYPGQPGVPGVQQLGSRLFAEVPGGVGAAGLR